MRRLQRILLRPFSILSAVLLLVSAALWSGVYPPSGVLHGIRIVTPVGIVEPAIEKAFRYRNHSYPGYFRIGFFHSREHWGYGDKWGIARKIRCEQWYDFRSDKEKQKLHQPIPRFLKSVNGRHLCLGYPQATVWVAGIWLVYLVVQFVRSGE